MTDQASTTRIDQAEEHQLRVLKVADLATLLATDAFEGSEPEEIEDFLDSNYSNPHASVKEIAEAVDGLELYEIQELLLDRGFHGLLMQVGTPVRKYLSADACSFSWGHFYTSWVYGSTYEEAWAQALDWAKSRAAANLEAFLKAKAAKAVEGGAA